LEKTLTKPPHAYLTLWMQHTPLTWYEQEDERCEAHLGKSFWSTNFTSCLNESWQTKDTARRCEQSTRAYKLTQSALFNPLCNSVTQTQQVLAVANRI
jgi:hypothetical protein